MVNSDVTCEAETGDEASLTFLSELTSELIDDDCTHDTELPIQEGGGGCGKELQSSSSNQSEEIVHYDRHKPKWWKQRVGRYVTKPQRRALEAMLAYRIVRPHYGDVLDFQHLMPNKNEIWMELGFGKGDNLLCLAQRHPNIGFVGVEVHPSSVAICLQRMQGAMERKQAWTGYQIYSPAVDPNSMDYAGDVIQSTEEWGESVAEPLTNVRVYAGDGIVLLESAIQSSSIDCILITFPDPFPTDKPHRLLQVHTVATMHDRLKLRGRLCLATDHAGFFDWAHQVIEQWNKTQSSKQFVAVNVDRGTWLPVISRYERKGWDEGRCTLVQCWVAAHKDY